MVDLLERAVETARALPREAQDDLARMMLLLIADEHSAIALTADEAASLQGSLAEAARGEFATEAEVRQVWSKHGL